MSLGSDSAFITIIWLRLRCARHVQTEIAKVLL